MTHEKALKILKENKERRIATIYIACKELAIKAIEKQIPKKPEESYDGYADGYPVIEYHCPNCNRELDSDEIEHHCECGQALDWSDNNAE